jgi:hypothetical protein
MNSYRLGLSLLKLKLPHLRGQLDRAFCDNEPLLDLCEAYAEATSYRDKLRRGTDLTMLAEYDLICSQVEVEVQDIIAFAESWMRFHRKI